MDFVRSALTEIILKAILSNVNVVVIEENEKKLNMVYDELVLASTEQMLRWS